MDTTKKAALEAEENRKKKELMIQCKTRIDDLRNSQETHVQFPASLTRSQRQELATYTLQCGLRAKIIGSGKDI